LRSTLLILACCVVLVGHGACETALAQTQIRTPNVRIGGRPRITREMLYGPIRVHMISGSAEYKSEASLKALAKHLESKYQIVCTFSIGEDKGNELPNLVPLDEAHVVIVFCRRNTLPVKQLTQIRRFCKLGPAADGQVFADLATATQTRRFLAIDLLMQDGSNRAAETLIKFINDPDPLVAGRCVYALGSINRLQDMGLFKKLTQDRRAAIRRSAVVAIGRYGRKKADNELLTKLLKEDDDAKVRGEAARILGRHYYWKAMPDLVEALNDPALDARRGAAYGVERCLGTRFPYRATQPASQRAREAAKIKQVYPKFKQANIEWLIRLDALEQQEQVAYARGVIGIRTASHAFSNWPEFDGDILGGQYQGHYGDEPVKVSLDPRVASHPILNGVEPFVSRKLYKNGLISRDAQLLAIGDNGTGRDEVAWAREHRGMRVLSTSLGVPKDFADASFRRMLTNAIFWIARRDPAVMVKKPK